jgi:hypothetical protein
MRPVRTLLLLLVALDDLGPSRLSVVRITTRLAERPSLAQEVPALVERDLDLLEALAVAIARGSVRLALPQRVLFVDELLDRPMNLRIVHDATLEESGA